MTNDQKRRWARAARKYDRANRRAKKHLTKTNRMIEIMAAANSELEKINSELEKTNSET